MTQLHPVIADLIFLHSGFPPGFGIAGAGAVIGCCTTLAVATT
jgi:hypothetical protein